MKRVAASLILVLLIALPSLAQSRYLPLGSNGSFFDLATTIDGSQSPQFDIKNALITAGYSLGARLDLQFSAGTRFGEIDGSDEVVPGAAFILNVMFFKQSPTIPFSMRAGGGFGFLTTLNSQKSIVGRLVGFDVLLTRDFYINKFAIGLGIVFDYIHSDYDITDNGTGTTTTTTVDTVEFGGRLDIFFPYVKENLMIIGVEVRTNTSLDLFMEFSFGLVFPVYY